MKTDPSKIHKLCLSEQQNEVSKAKWNTLVFIKRLLAPISGSLGKPLVKTGYHVLPVKITKDSTAMHTVIFSKIKI